MKRLVILITLIVLSQVANSQATENDTIVALGKLNPNSDSMKEWSIKINTDVKRGLFYIDTTNANSSFRNDPSSVINTGTNLSWDGKTLNATGSLSAVWGTITGTISSQTDLQNELNAKQNTITNSDDITEGSTNLFLTGSERTVIGNISGTNTGDQVLFTNSDETDQVFIASQASNIDAGDITNLSNLSGANTGDQDLSGKQDDLNLTTIGSSGASTLIGSTLNIPQYTGVGGDMSFSDSITYYYSQTYLDSALLALQNQLNDTSSFTLNAVFGLGSGQSHDTASFVVDAYCGSFRNWTGGTITIDSINAVMLGTNPDIDIQFFISTIINDASADELRTTDFNITSTTTGDTFNSFNGTVDVLPEQRIWCKVTSVTTKPTYLEITVAYSPK